MGTFRDPTMPEAELYKEAVELKDDQQLRTIVQELCPNVIWAAIFADLSPTDRQWVKENMVSEPKKDDSIWC